MNLLLALAVGVFFGCGAWLMLKRDLIRVAAGVIVLSNAANLLLIASGLSRGAAPILGAGGELPEPPVSDPLVQALVLTAIVITLGLTAVLLGLIFRVHASHGSLDQEELRQAEEREREALRRGEEPS